MTIDLAAGSELAGHRIDAVIGRGGMGVVYLAQHLRLGRKVALKVLVPALAEDATFRERFIRESQLAATLEHPNIIPIYDAGEVQDLLYISMRYVEGSDLSAWLRQDRTLGVDDTTSIMEQVASALDAAHGEGLVHRDVKPANILMEPRQDGSSRVFLTDFGITKSLRREGDSLTRAGQLMGTIDYMAPEQITSQPLDGRTDVYSLGCIVYRCLAGTVPYPRDHEVAVMYAHLQDTPVSITSMRPEVPEAVDKIVRKAMAKSKDARFGTCSEFIEALRASLSTPGATSPSGRRAVAGRLRPRVLDGPHALPPAGGRARGRRRGVWAVGTVGVLVTGMALAFLLLRNGSTSPSAAGTRTPTAGTRTPTTAPSGSRPPTPIRLTWKRITGDLFKASGNQTINRIMKTSNNTILAVGYTTIGGGLDPAVWTAGPDATSWTLRGTDDANAPGNQGMASVAAYDSEFVAVGSDQGGGDYNAAVWTSKYGTNWLRVPGGSSDPFGGPGDQLMRRVIAGGPGVVAVGSNGDNAGVWTFDGTGWTPQASSVFGMAGHAEEMWSVAILNGTIVAVGDDRVGDHQVAAAWFSPDQGLSWHRAIIRGGTGNGDQQMTTVVQAGPGLVAVGYDTFSGDENAAVWTSTDGRAWDEVQDPDFGGPGRQEMKGVIPVDGNVVAVGIDTTGSDQNGAVWISPNGETWTKHDPPALGGPAVQQVKSVVQVGQRLIAVGRDRSDTQDENAAVWVATVRPA